MRARGALALLALSAAAAAFSAIAGRLALPAQGAVSGASESRSARGTLHGAQGSDSALGRSARQAAAYFDAKFLRTSLEYNRTQLVHALNARALRWTLYLTLLLTPFLGAVAVRLERRLPGRPNLHAALLSTAVLLLAFLALLPISFASGYVTEHRYGLSNQTPAGWVADALKALLLWGTVSVLLTVLYFLLRRRWPHGGWTVLAAVAVAATALAVLVAPIVIDPLFYRFHPLQDEDLRRDLVQMAAREGIAIDRVLVVEASAKTVRENAYFTGLGRTKRVVLYDNLLQNASPAEVRQIFAHELGHWSRGHILKGLLLTAVALPLAAWLLWTLHGRLSLHPRLRLRGPTDPAAIPFLWLFLSAGLFLSLPLRNAISRSFEREADRVSLELTGDTATFVESQRRMAVNNLSWVDPPPALEWLFWTHPTTLERIRMAEEWREGAGG